MNKRIVTVALALVPALSEVNSKVWGINDTSSIYHEVDPRTPSGRNTNLVRVVDASNRPAADVHLLLMEYMAASQAKKSTRHLALSVLFLKRAIKARFFTTTQFDELACPKVPSTLS